MDTTIFDTFPQLTINGLWIGMLVFLVVQVAKYADFVKYIPGASVDIRQIRLALATAIITGLAWVAISLYAAEAPLTLPVVIGTMYTMLVGALTATLFYRFVFKPLLERLGVDGKYYRVE